MTERIPSLPLAMECFYDAESSKAADKFIGRLKSGEMKKDVLPDNTKDDYFGTKEHLDYCSSQEFSKSRVFNLIENTLEEEK